MEAGAGDAPLDERIVAAIERLSRALRALLQDAVKGHGLSPVQGHILLYLRERPERLRHVASIAREFGLTAPTVSDSVSALVGKGLVERGLWAADGRRSTLRLTPAGETLCGELTTWTAPLRDAVALLPQADREAALLFLMRLIERLYDAGVVSVARMCLTCRFFHPGAAGAASSYCSLLKKPLEPANLRVECPDHAPATTPA